MKKHARLSSFLEEKLTIKCPTSLLAIDLYTMLETILFASPISTTLCSFFVYASGIPKAWQWKEDQS